MTGIAAVFTKCMFLKIGEEQTSVAFSIYLPLLLATNIVGMIFLQAGFQSGRIIEVMSSTNVINKITAIFGGVLFLGEVLPPDRTLAWIRLVGFAIILVGTWVLGKITAELMTEVDKDLVDDS